MLPKNTQYEPDRIPYVVEHFYKPDFKIGPHSYIETKGLFLPADRAKHLHIRAQHPEVQIFLLFQDSKRKLNRASKTTYAMWAEKNNFIYSDIKAVEADPTILEEWIKKAKEHTNASKTRS